MHRLPSTALVFGTALSMSLSSCTKTTASADDDAEKTAKSSEQLDAIQASLTELKAEVSTLNTKIDSLSAKVDGMGSGSQAPTAEQEAAARKMLAELKTLLEKAEMKEAKTLASKMGAQYGNTNAYKSLLRRTIPELEVIGKKVPQKSIDSHLQSWFVDGSVDLDKGTTLLVFWEVWCPHCKKEMPELVALYDARKKQGLNVVGLTRLTKSSTTEKVAAFVAEHKLNYPVAKEDGAVAKMFNVGGIPAAAVVQNGEIIWRGHPSKITDENWDTWLK